LQKKLGLWIDLTNTDRFYKRSDIEMSDCQYVKLKCRGFGETPSVEQTQAFIELVDEFSMEHPIDVIGVHCTHGFNRTGFLIAAYLVEKLDFDVAAAIQQFAESRPPGIYKQDYINELYKRYGDEDDDPLRAPSLPDWCFDEEDGPDEEYQEGDNQDVISMKRLHDDADLVDGSEGGTSTSDNSPPKKKKRKFAALKLDATFMPGVPGVTLMTDPKRVNPLQHLIQDMCEWRSDGFPGSQPVSMDRTNLKLLHTKPYKVSWKADGTRYMMLIKHRDEIYFFDRDNSCFKVDGLTFLKEDLRSHIGNTLLDGEMVIDIHRGTSMPRYLIYDIVYLENENVGKNSFSERMRIINENIIKPRYEAIARGIINRANEPFGVRLKDFWNVGEAYKLLSEKFAKQLSHEPDGLIFQPKLEPYVSGRCDEVLKWKPSDQNSVDFLLRITQDSGTG
jgi:mRNA-capping enzyme